MRNPDPPNYFGSKYSLPHAAAALVVKGHLGYESFTEGWHDLGSIPQLQHCVTGCTWTEDTVMTFAAPRAASARVTPSP